MTSHCPQIRMRLQRLRLAPDGQPRPDAPFGRGPVAARVLGAVIRVAVSLGSRVPVWVTEPMATIGGTIEWALRPGKRRQLAENLAYAIERPPADLRVRRAVRREMVNEAHRSADLLWALGRPDEFRRSVEYVGRDNPQHEVDQGRGVVLASLHVGGWELGTTLAVDLFTVPATAIVADDWLAWAIAGMRERVGLSLIYRNAPVSRIGRTLSDGEVLIVLGDDASGDRPRMATVDFCGVPTELPTGAATLARLFQASVITFVVVRVGPRRWRVTFDPAFPPPPKRSGAAGDLATLQRLADRFTELVREYPDQWSAVYPISWLSAPRGLHAEAAPAEATPT